VAQVAPGCVAGVEPSSEVCGHTGIDSASCQELGCCWRENQCFMWGDQSSIFQKGLRPLDTPVQTHAGFDVARCSAETHYVGQGWDWAYSVDAESVCRIYSSRWHIYRTQESWTNDASYDTFEQLTWSKGARNADENFGNKYSTLNNLLLGCFPAVDTVEPGNVEDVEKHLWTWSSNTAEQCIASCRAEGYLIAGVRGGTNCYCTNRTLRRMDVVAESLCNVPCPGDNRQNCGAQTDYNAVYFASPMERFAGCFNDTAAIRQWVEWDAASGHTAEECIDKCSEREDVSNRRYYHHYAFVSNNGDCFCADQKTIVANAIATDPMECIGRCTGDYASRPDQFCGNPGVAAAYETFHNLPQRPNWSHTPNDWHRPLMRRIRFNEASNVAITDSTMTGFPLNLFTLFPELQTILSPRIILHASDAVIAPFEAKRCGAECFAPCGDIYYEESIVDNRDIADIRAWHINLSEISSRVGEHVKRVQVYAEVVIIDSNLHFPFSLVVRARQIVIDRSKAHTLTVNRDTRVLVDEYFSDNDKSPEADNLYQKLVQQCARILMSTNNPDHITTAFEMLDHVVGDFQYFKEQASMKTAVKLTRAEYSGLVRSELRHVPFYTKDYFRARLQIHYNRVSEWRDKYQQILNTAIAIDTLLQFTQDMLDIFVNCNIDQWKAMYEAQMMALRISQATYHAIYVNFSASRDNLDVAQAAFEQGLNDYANAQRRKGFMGFVKGFAKMVVGVFVGNAKMIVSGLNDFITTLDNLAETMEFMSRAMEKVEAIMVKLDYLMSILEDVTENGDLEELAGDVELIAQLRVMLVGWENMKHNSIQILSHPDALQIGGSQDYLTAILDTCNWGYALTETMIELAENYRRLMLIKAMLQNKIEMQERYTQYIEDCRANNDDRFHLVSRMVDMQHDIRMDVNDLLFEYCNLHFYEHQTSCSSASQPSLDGSLSTVLSRLNNALEDSIWGSGVPGSTCRPTTIRDSNTDPNCNDVNECPVKFFRETGMFRFNIPEDYYDFTDIDRYRIGRIVINLPGATSSGTPNNRLKLDIESSAPFGVQYQNNFNYFITRSLRVVHEYDVVTGAITFHAQLYDPQGGSNIHHRSPYTTWVIRKSSVSAHIDISNVQEVEVVFYGTGYSNTPKENEIPDPRCEKYMLE
jgi:hypothetical protein